MHAFLIVGNSDGVELANKLDAKLIEFPLQIVEDVRNLNNFLRLTINEKTLIFCKNIHLANVETLNAFLKNLEEPQENIFFGLTTNNQKSVLPTIVSRCQIIKSKNANYEIKNKYTIKTIDMIKDRQDAIDFINDLIFTDHNNNNFVYHEIYLEILKNLKANGNIGLQLASLVVRMKNVNGK